MLIVGACVGGNLGLVFVCMTYLSRPVAVLGGVLLAAALVQSAIGADPIEALVGQCDLIAEIYVHSGATVQAEIRYTDEEWSAKFAAVPDESRFSKLVPAGPFNGWYESRAARVVTALKGCSPSQTLAIDFNNYATDTNAPGENILFLESEHCIVFLTRYTNGHFGVVNLRDGKLPISDDLVRGWRGATAATPLADVIRQIREWVAAERKPRRKQ